jgi:hypothetical protein
MMCPDEIPGSPDQSPFGSSIAAHGYRIPSYIIHPADLAAISAAASAMRVTVVEYAKLAPWLHARHLREISRIEIL